MAAAAAAAPTPLVVECDGVSRRFGSGLTAVEAVHDVSFRIRSSARIALMGPSGSGKSTLLHLLAGLDSPTFGEVRWPSLQTDRLGRPVGIGVVFQGPSLLPMLDVLENVALPLLIAGQAETTAMRRAAAALDLVEIGELAPKLPSELSGGQAQRVAVARVLASRPSVILADEPTGRLDHRAGDQVISVLVDTANTLDAALIIATHDPAVAGRLTERWFIRDGRLDGSSGCEMSAP
jgi:ABC-type lipoprotein export system ATPase subunit